MKKKIITHTVVLVLSLFLTTSFVYADSPDTLFYTGLAYLQGNGVEADTNRGRSLLREAANAGSKEALDYLFNLVKATALYLNTQDSTLKSSVISIPVCNRPTLLQEEAETFQEAVDQGVADANYYLAFCCLHEIGMMYNPERAAQLNKSAVDSGNTSAMIELGLQYENGTGVEQDFLKAKELYEQAEKQNDKEALCRLAWIYALGHGVKQDLALAHELFIKADNKGVATAKIHMGTLSAMLETGAEGMKIDQEWATYFLEESARLGVSYAKYKLGCRYATGTFGLSENFDMAYTLLSEAFNGGYTEAADVLYTIGMALYNGDNGYERDLIRVY